MVNIFTISPDPANEEPEEDEQWSSPKQISIKEVDNGWLVEYRGIDSHDKHILICNDQYEVVYWINKLLCTPIPKSNINQALRRGPFR